MPVHCDDHMTILTLLIIIIVINLLLLFLTLGSISRGKKIKINKM